MIEIEEQVRESAKKRILFLPHAIKQMSRPERMISANEVKQTVFHGEIIEQYMDDIISTGSCGLCTKNGLPGHNHIIFTR